MMHRTVAVLLATVACSATAVAQGLGYAPHNAKYSITSKIHTVQEVMGQRTEVDASSEQQVTVAAIAKAAGLFDYSATIDSLAVTNSAGPPTDVSKIVGTKFVGVMGANGRISEGIYTVPAGGDEKVPQAFGLKNLLPVIIPNAKLGATWSDTVSGDIVQANGAKIKQTAIISYTMAGDSLVDGRKAFKLTYTAAASMTGTGSIQGNDFTIEGKTTGKGVALIASSGQYLGREGTEDANLTVNVEAAGIVVPITQTAQVKVALMK